jgi:hypothetical protein
MDGVKLGRVAILFAAALAGCSEKEGPRVASIPDVAWRLPTRSGTSPIPIGINEPVKDAMDQLRKVVVDHGRDPLVPWAITHAILALGLDVKLTNGRDAVDYLFSEYGEVKRIGETDLIGFPLRTSKEVADPETGRTRRVEILVEAHPELVLKAVVERGATPDREVVVQGRTYTLGHLYRHCMYRSWVEGGLVSHANWSNNAWGLRSLAAWAPLDLAWIAEDGRAMSLDGFTKSSVDNLTARLASRHAAMTSNVAVPADDTGLHEYTCGGAHFVDATGYALSRGFGSDEDRARFKEDMRVVFWGYPRRLAGLAAVAKANPELKAKVEQQRFKFIGHFVELTYKLAAVGAFEPSEAERELMIEAVRDLVLDVIHLRKLGVFENLDALRKSDRQMYLDYVGDSAHAFHGLEIATRTIPVAY